jgi:phosphoenolpyruvate-protein phosphotransferase/dihydroxyacetone kinase phosphotransfer subunit
VPVLAAGAPITSVIEMVGLVLVSHSRSLAEAAVDLIRRTVHPNVSITCSGGIGDKREELGTDAVEIQEAITSVYSEDGVLVLMDMGSAILSAETAKDLLDFQPQDKIVLSSAPLVEGGIAAAVQAQLGSPIAEVAKAARESLLPKRDHLQDSLAVEDKELSIVTPSGSETLELTIENEHGLHLRPAATLIKSLAGFQGEVSIENLTAGRGPVAARSLVDVTRLQIRQGDSVRFTIASPEPQRLIDSIRSLVSNQFGESPLQAAASAEFVQEPKKSGTFGVSRGIAIGHPAFLASIPTEIPTRKLQTDSEIASEISQLHLALNASTEDFDTRLSRLQSSLRPDELEVLEAQRMILRDPTILHEVEQKIRKDRLNSAAAWHQTLARHIADQEKADDPYFRARAADLREVERIALAHMIDKTEASPFQEKSFTEGQILVCEELTPSLAEEFSRLGISGVIQLQGGATSHGAILARALNLPAIGGAQSYEQKIRTAGTVAIDGAQGSLWIDPPPDLLAKLTSTQQLEHSQLEEALKQSEQPAMTSDGVQVLVAANAGSAQDISNALKYGAESVGLFRSEFLFQHFNHEPDEEEQLDIYRRAFENDRKVLPITVRLLDVGADKPLKFLRSQKEANPFLGVRGIRLLFANPAFLRTHLRALLRLAQSVPIKLLVPMITDVSEVLDLKRLLDEVAHELRNQALPCHWPIPLGAMIETPAAALLIDQLIPHVDFVSIGTNDLTQYLLCAERGNPALSAFADPLHPAVMRICEQVIRKSCENGVKASVCGEAASDPDAIPILLGLGLREFSVTAAAIPGTKSLIRKLSAGSISAQLASSMSSLSVASDVRKFSRSLTA